MCTIVYARHRRHSRPDVPNNSPSNVCKLLQINVSAGERRLARSIVRREAITIAQLVRNECRIMKLQHTLRILGIHQELRQLVFGSAKWCTVTRRSHSHSLAGEGGGGGETWLAEDDSAGLGAGTGNGFVQAAPRLAEFSLQRFLQFWCLTEQASVASLCVTATNA